MLLNSLFQRQGWKAARRQEGKLRRDNASPRHSKPQARFVPRLEALEDRTVPSYVFQNLLDDPSAGPGPGQGTQPNAINNSGEIVGLYFDASNVLHSYSQVGNVFTNIDPPNESTVRPFSIATGINPQGQIVGGYRGTDGVQHGYLLSGGQYTTFDEPHAVHGTRTFGINAPGQIVGIYWDANFTFRGFLLTQGQYTPIDDPLAGKGAFQGTIPFSLNASGQIVGVYIDSANINHGFLLSGGVFTTIDDPLGVGAQGGTQPSQINDTGQIVGGYFDATGLGHGYVQIGNQFTTVDDPAAVQGDFIDGNNDPGQLVGGYFDATGLEHGFLATPAQGNSARAAATSAGGVGESGFGSNLLLTNSLIPPTSLGTVGATSSTAVQPSPTAMRNAGAMAPAQTAAALSSQNALDSVSVGVRQPESVADAWLFAPFAGRDADAN